MKAVRVLLFSVAAILALLVVIVAVAFTSGFQTWATRRALASQPGLVASVGRVNAGLNHVQLEQFRVTQAGATLTLPLIDVDLSVLSAASHKVQVKKLVAKGWTIDLTAPAAGANASSPGLSRNPEPAEAGKTNPVAAPAQATAAVFQGVFNQLKLPVDLAVDAVELEGEIILPVGAGRPPARVHVTLTGGQLGAGREGKFTFAATTVLAPTAPVNALNASGTLAAAMDTPRTFSRLAAHVEAEARGPQFPQGTKLSAAVTAGQANAGESYTVVVETAGRKLLAVQADYPAAAARVAGTNPLRGTWMVDLTDDDLAPFALGRALPDFVAKGEGKFEAGETLAAFSASGRVGLSVDKLGVMQAELDALGPIKANLDFDLMHEGDTLHVTSLGFELAGARPVLVVKALQPFAYNPKTTELKVADSAKDLLSVDLPGLPLAWLQVASRALNARLNTGDGVHASAGPDAFAFAGGNLQGQFAVSARSNLGFSLRAVTPLALNDFAVTQSGRPFVTAVDLSVLSSVDYTQQGWQAELKEGTVRAGGVTVLTLAAKAGQLAGPGQPIKATGQWTANLPALLTQPVAGGLLALSGGRAAGDFAASLGTKQEIEAKFTLTGLAVDPKVSPEILPALTVGVRADIGADRKVTFNVPLVIEREGRKSDLTLDGILTPASVSSGLTVVGRLTSSFLAIEDAQILSAPLVAKPAPAPSAASAQKPVRDTLPFWSGVNGEVALALKKVSYQQSFEVTDVGGTLRIEAGAIKLDGARAGLGEGSDLKLTGGVTFDAKATEPYALKADLAVNNFNSAALFKTLNPGKPATIEGRFNVTSQLTALAPSSGQLAERTRGDFQLTSKGGTCRLLQADLSDKIQKTQSTVATIGGLLAAATGREKIADYANRTQIVTEVADDWKEIPFDQLNVLVRRDNDLNIMLQDFTLISPTKRIVGTGEIRHVAGTPLLAQALDLRLQLSAQGKTADLMNRASLLNGQKDNLGYVGFLTPIRIGGTLENPDTSEFRTALLKAAGSSLLNNLLGR